MRPRIRPGTARFVAIGLAATVSALGWLSRADDADPKNARRASEAAKRAVEPAAPELPGAVVGALQEGRFADAAASLETLVNGEKNPPARAYLALILGGARRLEGKPDAAREALQNALDADPKGPWAAKIRMELADVDLAAGRHERAEALGRGVAETLLGDDRKDRLARVYQDFAERQLKPNDPVTPADPKSAYDLFSQGRQVAKGEALRARLLFRMARAAQAAKDFPRAIQDFQNYLKEHPKGAEASDARFHLGEAQRDSGQALPARLTFSDLARDLADPGRRPATADPAHADDLRARSLYEIARTYGVPAPPDDTRLNLGVAALGRLLAAYPGHPLAVKAAYEIGASDLARGKSDEALGAFTRFLKEEGFRAETDEAKRELAALAMTATFEVGRVLQGQKKFDEAIAAWKGYLARFPNGPQSADAQRAVLDTQLLTADDHLAAERFDEARASWQAFLAQNPLDPRVPDVLYKVGESFRTEKKFDRAVEAWETLIGKFPASEPAAHARFEVAEIEETEKGDVEAAVERYREVKVEPWASRARERVHVMESKALDVATPKTFRTGETPHLKVTTRNLETLTFSAYKLNPEAYFRKKHRLEDVESLDIGLVAPDAEWTQPVPGYARYKPVATDYDLPKLEVPGVYVVKVSDEKTLQATTLVLGSDLDAIVKTSPDQILVFAQDMKTGQGRAGARVLVADGDDVVLDAVTGKDGVLLRSWDKPRELGRSLSYLVLDGPHAAGSGLDVPSEAARGLSARAFLDTDRPAYRPGQQVELRGVVREAVEGRYANPAKAVYKLEVTDSRGRTIVARPVTLSDFGTFHDRVPLDPGAPEGSYRVRLYQPGKSEFAGAFEVRSYQLQKIDLTIDLKASVVFRGQPVEADVVARHAFGAPAADRPVAVKLPDDRIVRGKTDASGKFHVAFPTEGFAEEQTLRLVAQLPEDGVGASARVALAVRAFSIDVSLPRDVYLDGESFQAEVATTDADGAPAGQSLSAALVKRVTQAGRTTEREVARKAFQTDAKTGKGRVALRADDAKGGDYVVRVAGTDRFGNPVVADRVLTVSGSEDEDKLRLLSDRPTYKVGEEARVNLHNRGPAGTAVLTWEADRILSYRIVALAPGDNAVAWPVDGGQFPNFTLSAARMAGARFDEARLDLRVERELRVTLTPTKTAVGPGDEVEVEVDTADQLGRPVAAEVSLAMVDRALLRLVNDQRPTIGDFFLADQTRVGAFTTSSTNTFAYNPATTAVSEAVVDEAERLAALEANAVGREQAVVELRDRLEANAPAEADKSRGRDKNLRPGMAGMGGMGGMLGEPSPVTSKLQYGFDNTQADFDTFDVAGNKMVVNGGFEPFGRNKAKENVAIRSRQRFVETAYWNPSVVTGADGKARVSFRAPSALSEYRITARGVTGADTLVGESTAGLAVRKDFFVDFKTPASLNEGDRPRFVARVHHRGAVGTLEVSLKAYGAGREGVYPKTVEVKADGVDEILFDPYEVPADEAVRLSLTAKLGDARDEIEVEIPVRPWGVQAFASASGTASDDATVFVGLPPGRAYENPEMLVVVSPTLQRMIVETALGHDYFVTRDNARNSCILPPPDATSERASDLLAAASALAYLRTTRGATSAPEAARLVDRVRGLVAELSARQNEDGGWPWVAPAPAPGRKDKARSSDRLTSARVVWALATVEPLGLLTDPAALEKAAGYLAAEFAKAAAGDHETRAVLLHALSTRGKASFETANSLNRLRQGLSDAALAYLALTFAAIDRPTLAAEVLGVLGPRGKVDRGQPGDKPGRSWGGTGASPGNRSAAEATALAALAFARVRPQAPELDEAARWLLAHRQGLGWQPPKAKGPAIAALAAYYGRARGGEDRYDLVVTVNDAEVYRERVAGASAGRAISVPVKALKAGDRNRVRFDVEGRGTFGYAVTLTGFTREFGPDQDRAGRTALVDRRVYLPAPPEYQGKPLPTGFAVAVNPATFENRVSQVAPGGRARVELNVARNEPNSLPDWERDFLVVEEHLPAGATLIEGSVETDADAYELADGTLTLYFAPDKSPGRIAYDVFGYLPGRYRTLPASVRSAYEPGRSHLGGPGELRVLPPGEAPTDPYRATPDELYARGKALFDDGKAAEAAGPLEELFNAYTLRDDVAKDAARMLLLASIKAFDARKVVQYFEVVKEKAPDLVLTFDDLRAIGRAYRDIGEHERAYLVWKGVVDASYLEDARIGEVLRQRGKTLEGVAYLLDLWREYPDSAPIEADLFALAQLLARLASKAIDEPALRRELAGAGVTRSDLVVQSTRLIQAFLARSPASPLADEASLAVVNNVLELDDDATVVKLASRYAKLYPKSPFLDSFQYAEALGEFHLGHYDRAVEVAEAIAEATYKDASGAESPSPNKWQAVYILGQIFDARRQPSKAITYYRQVADRFTDAADAVRAYTRKDLKLAEVTVVRPTVGGKDVKAAADEPRGRALPLVNAALRNPGAPPAGIDEPDARFPDAFKLGYRNLAEVDLKVYPVDLMRLYLTRRNLDEIAAVDLAGITPLVERTVPLGRGEDFADKLRTVDLNLTREGAYLVMARGENRYASGIVLVTPLELDVLEEPEGGRLRVTVTDAATGAFVPRVQVKVIGSRNDRFVSGETDLRGVFVAEGIRGEAAAVARKGAAQYAFYRGKTPLGAAPPAGEPRKDADAPGEAATAGKPSLLQNLQYQNAVNQSRQIDRLEKRFQNPQNAPNGAGGAAAGGFR